MISYKEVDPCIESCNDELHKCTASRISNKKAILGLSLIIVASFLFAILVTTIIKVRRDKEEYKEIRDIRSALPLQLQKFDDVMYTKFDELNADMGTTFISLDDIITHFKILVKNAERTKVLNNRNTAVRYGFNRFLLMTDAEMASKELMPVESLTTLAPLVNVEKLPRSRTRPKNASYDWREHGVITPVKNQNKNKDSWAFAITAAVEAFHAIRHHHRVNLAEQELIDCVDHHDKDGNITQNGFDYVRTFGLAHEIAYPYSGIAEQCRNVTEPKLSISGWGKLPSDEVQIADWVATKGPVVVGIIVTREMLQYESGILSLTYADCHYRAIGAHYMTIVGYGTEVGVPYWILKNSWGDRFGEGGYIKIKRGVNTCGIAQWAFAVEYS